MHVQALRELFQQYGSVINIHLLKDHATGADRGMGFVTMAAPRQAQVRGLCMP